MVDDDLPDLHDIETPFNRRVASRIDADTTPFELVASLDERDLPVPKTDAKSRSPFPLSALVRVSSSTKFPRSPSARSSLRWRRIPTRPLPSASRAFPTGIAYVLCIAILSIWIQYNVLAEDESPLLPKFLIRDPPSHKYTKVDLSGPSPFGQPIEEIIHRPALLCIGKKP